MHKKLIPWAALFLLGLFTVLFRLEISRYLSDPVALFAAGCILSLISGVGLLAAERTLARGNKLDTLTNQLADAVASGKYTDEQLDAVRALNRKGQFYWDFVFVENSEGVHNSKLTEKCLDQAEEAVDPALALR